MIWSFIVVSGVILLAILVYNSISDNVEKNKTEVILSNNAIDIIPDLLEEAAINNQVVLSDFLKEIGVSSEQEVLYKYLTSSEFKSIWSTDMDGTKYVVTKTVDKKGNPDIILSYIEEETVSKDYYEYLDEEDELDAIEERFEEIFEEVFFNLEEFSDGVDTIELPIRGINYRGLSLSDKGVFDGFIQHDKLNEYDPYAIAIYGNNGIHYGFVEKGQKEFCKIIEDLGGLVNVIIEVNSFVDERKSEEKLYGKITINKIDLIQNI